MEKSAATAAGTAVYLSLLRMESPDDLISQCRNLARMPEGETKESLKQIAEELLQEREARGEITAEFRAMLSQILRKSE